jgi:ABC-type amino acid transport/signal transduction systems, periplasmic component/domain
MYSSWNSLFAPGTKKFDISFQEATITSQRKKTVDFTSSYLNANQGVLISKQTTAPKSIADLKQLQTCAQTNTTGLDWINSQLKPSKRPLTYPTTTAAYQAVPDQPVPGADPRRAARRTREEAEPEQVRACRRPDRHARAVRRGPPRRGSKLLMPVDAVLTKLTKNGTVGKLQKKWFNLNFAVIPTLK